MKDYIKPVWEALRSDVKTRLIIAISFTIFLLCRDYIENLPGGSKLFSILAVFAFLICIIFWTSLVIDGGSNLFKIIQEKRTYRMYVNYLLNLSDDKFSIVNDLYLSSRHQGKFKYNDTNIRDLMKKGIIELSQNGNLVSKYELNDPTVNFILTPTALEVIENNYSRFKK